MTPLGMHYPSRCVATNARKSMSEMRTAPPNRWTGRAPVLIQRRVVLVDTPRCSDTSATVKNCIGSCRPRRAGPYPDRVERFVLLTGEFTFASITPHVGCRNGRQRTYFHRSSQFASTACGSLYGDGTKRPAPLRFQIGGVISGHLQT
jgi:hypothetical protein